MTNSLIFLYQESRFSAALSDANGSYSTASPPPLQPQLSGISVSLLDSFDDDGLTAFEQDMEQLNKGMKSACSFDTLMGLDLLDSEMSSPHSQHGSAKSNNPLKVQGGVSKKATGSNSGSKSKSGSHAVGKDSLADVFSDLDCGLDR